MRAYVPTSASGISPDLEVIKRQLLNHGLVDAGQEHVLSEGIL